MLIISRGGRNMIMEGIKQVFFPSPGVGLYFLKDPGTASK